MKSLVFSYVSGSEMPCELAGGVRGVEFKFAGLAGLADPQKQDFTHHDADAMLQKP